jgi:hypothetical protein
MDDVRGSRIAVLAVLALLACKKSEQQAPGPTPSPTPAPGPAPTAIDAPAAIDAGPQADVDLLHAIPSKIRVSSTVANPKILPSHIADFDEKTAWNSKTGELVGAWVEITLGDGAEAHELRLTAGFTATGPKGEDWFTMNPRIKKLTVTADNKVVGTFTLDIANRGLQAFPVKAENRVSVEIAEIVPGSKKTWREASISEIELWGRPPAGWKEPKPALMPSVGVGADSIPSAPDDPCAAIEAAREEFTAAHANDHHEGPGGEDHAYPPRCDSLEMTGVEALPAPWSSVKGWCYVQDEIYGPKTCSVEVKIGAETSGLDVGADGQSTQMTAAFEAKDVLATSPGPELIVRVAHPDGESLAVCRTAPKLRCSTPILTAGRDWTGKSRFDKTGALVIDKLTGDPQADALGVHPLVFAP